MKFFEFGQIREALEYSQKVSVHLHDVVFDNSPLCFRAAVNRRKECIAHVFCKDADLLRKMARKLGIKVIYIDKEGNYNQHLDLCGVPLKKLFLRHIDRLLKGGPSKDSAIDAVCEMITHYPGCRSWINE